jgi:putative transposon-encoded protein
MKFVINKEILVLPEQVYESEVKAWGNGGGIRVRKEHRGKKVLVIIKMPGKPLPGGQEGSSDEPVLGKKPSNV